MCELCGLFISKGFWDLQKQQALHWARTCQAIFCVLCICCLSYWSWLELCLGRVTIWSSELTHKIWRWQTFKKYHLGFQRWRTWLKNSQEQCWFTQNRDQAHTLGHQKSCNHQKHIYFKFLLLFLKLSKTIKVGTGHGGNFGFYGLNFAFIFNYLGWGGREKNGSQNLFNA